MTQDPDWAEGVHQRIAQAIRSVREGRLTAQQLAEETKRLGHPISRSQIANYESGRKQSLDVAELLVIAGALGVSPMSLLFPGEPDEQVEMLPDRPTPTLWARAWFGGDLGSISGQVAGLTEQLGRIDRAITMVAASFASEGSFGGTMVKGEQETK
jgi:transcriptional regulator with XRE-family HTH domain